MTIQPSFHPRSPYRVESAQEVASAFTSSLDLGLSNGMLVVVTNNDPAGAAVEAAVQETIHEANELGIVGRGVTPYILKNVAEKTKGDSLRPNLGF